MHYSTEVRKRRESQNNLEAINICLFSEPTDLKFYSKTTEWILLEWKEVKRWLKTSWVSRTSWLPRVQLTGGHPAPPRLHGFYTESRMNRQRGRWKRRHFALPFNVTPQAAFDLLAGCMSRQVSSHRQRPRNKMTGQRKTWSVPIVRFQYSSNPFIITCAEKNHINEKADT